MKFVLLYKIDFTDASPIKTAIRGAVTTVFLMCALHAWRLL